MAIIDAQGRIFRKINILDFMAMILLLLFVPMFFYSIKLYRKHTETVMQLKQDIKDSILRAEFPEIEFNCRFLNIDKQTYDLMQVGDQENDPDGKLIAKIMVFQKDQVIFTHQGSKNVDINTRLKLRCQMKDNQLYFRTRPIGQDVKRPFIFHPSYSVSFIIMPPSENYYVDDMAEGASTRSKERVNRPELNLIKLEKRVSDLENSKNLIKLEKRVSDLENSGNSFSINKGNIYEKHKKSSKK